MNPKENISVDKGGSVNGSTSPAMATNACPEAAAVPKEPHVYQDFRVPPEAPVFTPTEAEFADPLKYINKIRPIAEKTGICKIRPPQNWQPPFAVDVDKLKFTPRIQRLNELEAKTRVKLNFLDQIAKFWELQGTALKIPMVEKRALDLYTLHSIVEKEGGFTVASRDRKWSKIATLMGYPQYKGIGTILKTHYERLLFPYEVFNEKNNPSSLNQSATNIELIDISGPDSQTSPSKSSSPQTDGDSEYLPPPKLTRQCSPPGSSPQPNSIGDNKAAVSPNKKQLSPSSSVTGSPTQTSPSMPTRRSRKTPPEAPEQPPLLTQIKEDELAADVKIKQIKVEPIDVDEINSDGANVTSSSNGAVSSTCPSTNNNPNGISSTMSCTSVPIVSGNIGGGAVVSSSTNSGGVNSKELRRLQFYGAGPKMAGYNDKEKQAISRKKNLDSENDPRHRDKLAKYICRNCGRGDGEENMLLCDGCDDSYHTFCLMPPVSEIPKGDWCCPKCVAAEVSKPTEAFGFEQAQREYNLQQFGEMADTFKSDYFNMPVHMVPTSMVEKEFWRIVSSIDEDVTVEYGADLHTMDHGSGFPTKNSINLLPGDREYACSGWNLNNLPVLEGSVLGFINADISGMKVPWMYVGMCFATFCWHNEDHWSYSINYLHWGEPKTWYGVPGSKAEQFEQTMKSAAPELFDSQPDLLHQLVTIMNPNILMSAGVPVYRTDQNAGEFVITFPRAYHAGFNQGYNFAEAVNFAPADWVSMGRECVLHYSQLRRFCVFSHDELVCKMATNCATLDMTIAAATYIDMLRMADYEKRTRKFMLDWGVTNAEREAFELLPDDERQCEVCKTTCFMSALTCTCNPKQIVCLRHYESLCSCPPKNYTLRYRYTLDELLPFLRNLKNKAESFDRWVDRVKVVLGRKINKTVELSEVKGLLAEASTKKFPRGELINTLSTAIDDAEKCASVIKQLDLNKVRTRHSSSGKFKLTLEELTLFVEEIDGLACAIEGEKIVRDLLKKCRNLEEDAGRLCEALLKNCIKSEVDSLLKLAMPMCIELPGFVHLKKRQTQLNWLHEVYNVQKANYVTDVTGLRKLLDDGAILSHDSLVEEVLDDLTTTIRTAEEWEKDATHVLARQDTQAFYEVDDLLKRAEAINVFLPSEQQLIDSGSAINQWLKHLQSINALAYYPYINLLEEMLKRARGFVFNLDEVEKVREFVSEAKNWQTQTEKAFTLKMIRDGDDAAELTITSNNSLMDNLSPRLNIRIEKDVPRNTLTHYEESWSSRLKPETDPTTAANLFKEAEEAEVMMMRALRIANKTKRLFPETISSMMAPAAQVKVKMESQSPLSKSDTFCTCGRPANDLMMRCDLCRDWFHSGCVTLPDISAKYQTAGSNWRTYTALALTTGYRRSKFLCPCCQRTKRPRLEAILSLLMCLQKLHARLPEGEALQSLTIRAMNWQDRARKLLRSTDYHMREAMAKIRKMTYGKTRKEKGKKQSEISRRLKKMATGAISSDASNSDSNSSNSNKRLKKDNSDNSDSGESDDSATKSDDTDSDGVAGFNDITERMTDCDENGGGGLLRDSERLFLPMHVRLKIEDLMMEGDLLEVDLDENQQLWQLFIASSDPNIIDFNIPAQLPPTILSSTSSTTNLTSKQANHRSTTASSTTSGSPLGHQRKRQRLSTPTALTNENNNSTAVRGKVRTGINTRGSSNATPTSTTNSLGSKRRGGATTRGGFLIRNWNE